MISGRFVQPGDNCLSIYSFISFSLLQNSIRRNFFVSTERIVSLLSYRSCRIILSNFFYIHLQEEIHHCSPAAFDMEFLSSVQLVLFKFFGQFIKPFSHFLQCILMLVFTGKIILFQRVFFKVIQFFVFQIIAVPEVLPFFGT